ncbi:hypothetical protein CIY_14100 [Butyrivibrio fibrisolvens 16/4]|nr:hypothetical protein CIY_14100 [Butyrivibrio fibrisolvens 16/4]
MWEDSGFGSGLPSNDGGYNIHAEFNDKYPQPPKSNHNVVKFMLVSIVVVVAIAIISSAVDAYSEHQSKAAEDARQEFAAEVENMDLSPYCKKYIKDLSVTKTDFNGTGGSSYDNDLYHSNSITIEGISAGTERLSHQQVYNYMFATLNELYDDIEAMCADSTYVHHLNRGHAMNRGDRVYHYRNYINFYLSDSEYEYSVSLFYPPVQAANKKFFVKALSSENKGEEWSYRITDKNGDYIFEYSHHYDSDAVRAEREQQRITTNRSSSESSTSRRTGGTYKKKDTYNSSRYKDADSFAEDYYEDFYDYDDYEDDDDAYDAAVDYWNDWND